MVGEGCGVMLGVQRFLSICVEREKKSTPHRPQNENNKVDQCRSGGGGRVISGC